MSETKTEHVRFRMTPSTKRAIKTSAKAAGLGVSEFLRRRGTGRSIQVAESAARRKELRTIGRKLQAIGTQCGEPVASEVRELIGEIRRVLKDL